MQFGYHHPSFRVHADALGDGLTDRARWLEAAGFDWFTLMDHLWQLPGVGPADEPFVECYTGLAAVAEATERMRLSALVTCTHYRNPGFLAKTVATLDALSGGRAMLGIGAGWYAAEYEALGIPFPEPATRIRQLRDVIRLCRAAWSEPSPVTYAGEFYDLDDLYLEPKPDVPVLVGGAGEQLTLRVVADEADAWNTIMRSPERYAHKLDVLRGHCETMGRAFDDIEKTCTVTVVVRSTAEAAHEAFEALAEPSPREPPSRDEFRGLVGTAEEVAAGVEAYRDLGVDTFQIRVPGNDRESIERFVDDVMPEFA